MARALWMLMASAIWTAFSGLAAYLYSPVDAVVGLACLGGFTGSLLGAAVGDRTGKRLRLPVLYLVALLGWLAAMALASSLRSYDFWSNLWGPSQAYVAATGLTWLAKTFFLSLVLRASSVRRPVFVVAEGAMLATVVARMFVGHRDGHINRPFFLVDRLWSNGYDPLPVFMAIGALLAVLIVALANSSGGRRQGALRDTVVAVLLIAGLFIFAPVRSLSDLPKPPKLMSENGDSAGDSEQRYGDSDKPDFNDRKRGGQNAPAGVVLFENDFETPEPTFYFRQRVYSSLEGRTLVSDSTGPYDRDVPRDYPTDASPTGIAALDPALFQKVDTLVCLISEFPTPLGLTNPAELRPAANPDPSRFRQAYAVSSHLLVEPIGELIDRRVGSESWDEATRQHYLALPDDPRYKELAAEIEAKVATKFQGNLFAHAVVTKLWLDEHGTYCLKTKHAQADDPVADFLFGDRTGYCVYFAHAACFLYRAQGVPARVAGGYAVPVANRGTGAALVLGGRYAHAWPEIYLQGVGWLPLDINPEKTLEEPIPPPDESLQQLLGEMARKKGDGDPKGQKPRRNLQQMARQGLLGLVTTLPWLLLALFVALHLARARHRYLATRGRPARLPVFAYRAILQRLAELGLVREVGETRLAFAERAQTRCPSFPRLTRLHLEMTLGSGRGSDDVVALYRQAQRDLESGLNLGHKIRVGLDPISWWRAR